MFKLIFTSNLFLFVLCFNSLNDQIYKNINSIGTCLRHLNATGTIGCQDKSCSFGIIYRLSNEKELDDLLSNQLPDNYIAVVSSNFLSRPLLEKLKTSSKVHGVIVPLLTTNQAFDVFQDYAVPTNFSEDIPSNLNPFGRNLFFSDVPFPMMAIPSSDGESISLISDALKMNINYNYRVYPLYGAEMKALMYATRNSEVCLRRSINQPRKLCWPLGGNSVYSSVLQGPSVSDMPIVWISSIMDSRSIFPDFAFGLDGYRSGMISALAIADAFSKLSDLNSFRANVVFTFFNAETWDFSGSSRFFRDLKSFSCDSWGDQNSCSKPFFQNTDFRNLSADRTLAFVELGSLLYSNSSIYSYSSSRSNALETLLKLNSETLNYIQKDLSNMSLLPPSSLRSFFNYSSERPHLVLEDFDSVYSNPYYNSPYDSALYSVNSSLYVDKICKISSMVAKSVYSLAKFGNISNVPASPANVSVDCGLINTLFYCLNSNFSCDLVSSDINNRIQNGTITGYPFAFTGDFSSQTTNPPSLLSYFIYQFMSNSFNNQTSLPCSSDSDCSNFCLNGFCRNSFTRYHDAYGLGLEYDYSNARFTVVSNELPSWTVSNFNLPTLKIFLTDSSVSQAIELIAGIIILISSLITTYYTKSFLYNKLKID